MGGSWRRTLPYSPERFTKPTNVIPRVQAYTMLERQIATSDRNSSRITRAEESLRAGGPVRTDFWPSAYSHRRQYVNYPGSCSTPLQKPISLRAFTDTGHLHSAVPVGVQIRAIIQRIIQIDILAVHTSRALPVKMHLLASS